MNEAAREEIKHKLGVLLTELKAMLERATADEMGAFGAYVITTSPGCYYRDGAQGMRTLTWASRYVTRLGAALVARNIRDGFGSPGKVMEYRLALQLEIERVEETIATLTEVA